VGFGVAVTFARADEPAKAAPASTPEPATPAKEKKRLDLPVPKGQPQRGLRIPLFAPDGKLMMSFQIGVAEVVDADNIKMGDLRLETFKEDGAHELDINVPDSVFNAKTWELTTKASARMKRHDLEISGKGLVCNLDTKVVAFSDGVKMIIYDARAAIPDDAKKAEVPAVEIKPEEEKKK
jgi:hypothetical protein